MFTFISCYVHRLLGSHSAMGCTKIHHWEISNGQHQEKYVRLRQFEVELYLLYIHMVGQNLFHTARAIPFEMIDKICYFLSSLKVAISNTWIR